MSATLAPVPTPPTTPYAGNGDPFLFKRVRTWWLLLALLLLADENSIFTVASRPSKSLNTLTSNASRSTSLLQLLTVTLWLIVAGLMVTRLGPTLRLMLKQRAILSFAILAFLSTLWTQIPPQVTFRKATWLFLVFGFAWFFASCYRPADQMRLLLVAGLILALASIAMAILLPQYGLDSGGEWKGVFGQKNHLGLAMLFLFAGLFFRPISRGRRLLAVAIQAILPIGLIVLSQSRGSLILILLLIVVRLYGPFLGDRRRDQLPFVLYASVLSIVAIAFSRGVLLSLLGRDSTLTGRTREWAVLVFYALRHLWLGYGYQAFWSGTADSFHAMRSIGANIYGADSGYLETMLELGIVGVGLWFILLMIVLSNILRLLRRPSVPLEGYWYAGIILVTFAGSVTEVLFPVPAGISTFVFVVACAGLTNLGREVAPRPEFRSGS